MKEGLPMESVLMTLLFLLPFLLFFAVKIFFRFSVTKAERTGITSKPFVCPHCGQVFYVKWYQLLFFKPISIYLYQCAKFKCPGCGIRDMCRHQD